jgi:hypothetical protein
MCIEGSIDRRSREKRLILRLEQINHRCSICTRPVSISLLSRRRERLSGERQCCETVRRCDYAEDDGAEWLRAQLEGSHLACSGSKSCGSRLEVDLEGISSATWEPLGAAN